jgi:hypothetical protein
MAARSPGSVLTVKVANPNNPDLDLIIMKGSFW